MGVDHPGLPMSMADLIRTIRRIARQTIQNASIGRAGIRVYDGGWIRIEDGGLSITGTGVVSGTFDVSGLLKGSGTFDWTGPMNLKGAQSVTGPTTFVGKVDITGPLNVIGTWKLTGNGEIIGDVDLKGILRLLSDLLVKAGGRIVIEGADQIVLEQAGGVARMRMGASEIRGGDGLGLYPNSGPSIISTSAGLRLANLPTISAASSGLMPDSVHIDALGFVRRVV